MSDYASQSNTQAGDLVFPSAADLSAKEGYLAKVVNTSGVAQANLPSADTDNPFFLILDGGDASGDNVTLRPLAACGRTIRAVLSGTCSPGDRIVAEAVATAAGKVRTCPSGAATYKMVGIALEAGVAGQLIHIAPCNVGNLVVT
jgi:hypothetical protein